MEYPNKEESFIAERMGENSYNLRNIDGSQVTVPFDTLRVKEFVSRIKFIGFETYILDSLNTRKRDSLAQTEILGSFTVENIKGEKNNITTYRRPNTTGLFDPDGNLFEYDVDNLYGVLNNNEVVILQYPIIDPIMFTKQDFLGASQSGQLQFKEVVTP